MDTLLQSLREIEKMDQARVIILAAEGPVFSSGHNLKELMADEGPDRHREVFSKYVILEQIV
jgi:enoyl-CoA hydratase/carnithine racemase